MDKSTPRPDEAESAPCLSTAFFTAVAVIGPWLVPRGPNRQDIQIFLITTAISMWVLHITVFTAQQNPSFGPDLTRPQIEWLASKWGRPIQQLPPPLITITVGLEASAHNVSLMIGAEEKMHSVKAMIREAWKNQHKLHVLTNDHYLTFNELLLGDDRTVKQYRVRNGSALMIKYRDINVLVSMETSGRSVSTFTKSYYTIDRLKADIAAKWEQEHNEELLPESYYLIFNRKTLDEKLTVGDYNIRTASYLLIKIRMVTVTLEYYSDLVVSVPLVPSASIRRLKDSIRAMWRAQHKFEVMKPSHSLYYGDTELKDADSEADSDLHDGSVLMVKRPVITNPKDVELSHTNKRLCKEKEYGKGRTLEAAYAGTNIFHGDYPKIGDIFQFRFLTPKVILRLYFRSSYNGIYKDFFYDTVVELLPAGKEDYYLIGAFSNSDGTFEAQPGDQFGPVDTIRFRVGRNSPHCVLVDKIEIDTLAE